MNTNKKQYVAPAVIELEMGAMNIFAGSPSQQKANARAQINAHFWDDTSK